MYKSVFDLYLFCYENKGLQFLNAMPIFSIHYLKEVSCKSEEYSISSAPYTAIKIASLGYKRGKSVETYMQIGSQKVNEKQLKEGFNFAIVDEWSGRLETLRSFNTHNKKVVKQMESFLNKLPTDRMVVGVVKGEAFQGIQDNVNAQIAVVSLRFKS